MSNATKMNGHSSFLVYRGTRDVWLARKLWNESRRATYLLKIDTDVPWSLDRKVLPESTGDTTEGAVAIVCKVMDLGPGHGVDEWRGAELADIEPALRGWELIGYDICDCTGTSGLSNCSYDSSRVHELRDRWSALLNGYHLFPRLDDAASYRLLTDSRVPEHAPFAVVALWRAPSLGQCEGPGGQTF
jgi:hypothetical protein